MSFMRLPGARSMLAALPLVAVLAGVKIALAHQRLEVASERSTVLSEMHRVRDEVSRMNIELATLMRPDRLRRVAARRLGMRPPAASQVVRW